MVVLNARERSDDRKTEDTVQVQIFFVNGSY
jgi:hypothetical protein